MSRAGHLVSTQPVGKGGPLTPQAQSDDNPSSVNATPPPPHRFSDGVAASGAAGSGTLSGAGGPQVSPTSPALLEDTGGTDDERDDDPEEGAWLGNDGDDAEAGWDEQNKAMDLKVIAWNKLIAMNLLEWDMHMHLERASRELRNDAARGSCFRVGEGNAQYVMSASAVDVGSVTLHQGGCIARHVVRSEHTCPCIPKMGWRFIRPSPADARYVLIGGQHIAYACKNYYAHPKGKYLQQLSKVG